MTATHNTNCTASCAPVLYLALELGASNWKLAFTVGLGQKPRLKTITARSTLGLLWEIKAAQKRLGLPEDAPVLSCYEAGRDGFWLHRFLLAHGVQNQVVDSSRARARTRSEPRRPRRAPRVGAAPGQKGRSRARHGRHGGLRHPSPQGCPSVREVRLRDLAGRIARAHEWQRAALKRCDPRSCGLARRRMVARPERRPADKSSKPTRLSVSNLSTRLECLFRGGSLTPALSRDSDAANFEGCSPPVCLSIPPDPLKKPGHCTPRTRSAAKHQANRGTGPAEIR